MIKRKRRKSRKLRRRKNPIKKCKEKIKSGLRKGKNCGAPAIKGSYCGRHSGTRKPRSAASIKKQWGTVFARYASETSSRTYEVRRKKRGRGYSYSCNCHGWTKRKARSCWHIRDAKGRRRKRRRRRSYR